MRISDWSSDVCSSDLPKAALLSRSNFGSGSSQSGAKMQQALALIREREPGLEIDGEMHGDCALDEALRRRILPSTTLQGEANLLICPNVDRSEEHTSELQSLMRISYAVFCLKKKTVYKMILSYIIYNVSQY